VASIIGFCFVAGLIASAITGAIIFLAAALRLLQAAGTACLELSHRPAALAANWGDEDFSHPRARFN
jgi:hypothetical protein